MVETDLLRQVNFYLNQKTGLVLSRNQSGHLQVRLKKILENHHADPATVSDLLDRNPQFFEQILEEVLINESYFFRNPDHFRVLREIIFPVLLDRLAFRKDKSLRVLSIGCSTGQEPLSILFTFYETNHSKDPVDIHVDAIDLSRKAIVTALTGEYTRMQSRGLSEEMTDKYFVRGSRDRIRVLTGFLDKISYYHGNILDFNLYDHFYDLVFARNTLIYFDDVRQEQVKQKLVKGLKSGGYLFLGESEIGYGLGDRIQSMKFNQSIVYRKR
ncbi:MAG: hypothetical protein HUU10_03975 [Bacteroidetes bacterium]|nr:hypothetical protein [Bacteroidota bacterium]